MKILVTVGSSSYESLIQAVDIAAETLPKNKYIFQISNGIYKPSNGSYFSFTNKFLFQE